MAVLVCSPFVQPYSRKSRYLFGFGDNLWNIDRVSCQLGWKEWEHGWRLAYGGGIIFALLLLVFLLIVPHVSMPHRVGGLFLHGAKIRNRRGCTRLFGLVLCVFLSELGTRRLVGLCGKFPISNS